MLDFIEASPVPLCLHATLRRFHSALQSISQVADIQSCKQNLNVTSKKTTADVFSSQNNMLMATDVEIFCLETCYPDIVLLINLRLYIE